MSVTVSGSIKISGSTEVGYKLNTKNLILAYDAGSEDSYPPPPNISIYDLSGNYNSTSLPSTVTYENISSSFFFTASIANSAIPFVAPELGTTNFATFEMVAKITQFTGVGLVTLFGFNNYYCFAGGSTFNFGDLSGALMAYTSNVNIDDWFHLVATMYETGSFPLINNKMWINSISKSIVTSNLTDNANLNFSNGIGRIGLPNTDNSQIRMSGYIPVFKIYKRILSQQEITENYNFYKNRYPIS